MIVVLYRSVSDLNQSRLQVYTGTGNLHRLFSPADSLLPGVKPAQQQSRFEEPNRLISVPISEMMVIADLRSIPGMVQRRLMLICVTGFLRTKRQTVSLWSVLWMSYEGAVHKVQNRPNHSAFQIFSEVSRMVACLEHNRFGQAASIESLHSIRR